MCLNPLGTVCEEDAAATLSSTFEHTTKRQPQVEHQPAMQLQGAQKTRSPAVTDDSAKKSDQRAVGRVKDFSLTEGRKIEA